MRKLAVVTVVLGAVAALMAGPAAATTNPQAEVTVRCWNGGVTASFTYTGMSRFWHLTATQMLTVDDRVRATKTYTFDGPAGSSAMATTLPRTAGPFYIQASTSVVGGAGRLKAQGGAMVTCRTPSPPPPDDVTVKPQAAFWGPCGDPFYRAILNNRRSDRPVKFSVTYQPFGEPRRTFYRWVPAHQRNMTGLFDVAGSTRMTIRWVRPGVDRVLASKVSAPNRVYAPCPSVAVIH